MHPDLISVTSRLAADFPDFGDGPPRYTDTPEAFTYTGHTTLINAVNDPESLTAFLADQFQDDVIDNLGRTWPEADGHPLFARLDHGQAWWMRDGDRFAPIGQLDQAPQASSLRR